MYLFFDDPLDKSFDHFRNIKNVICILCDAGHWHTSQADISSIDARQTYNAALALQWARSSSVDWIIHIDSDELIFTGGKSLKDYLRQVDQGVDAITFPTLEAMSKLKCKQHFFRDICWFKLEKSVVPHAQGIARRLGCCRAFQYGYFRGHSAGKTATRVSSSVASLNIHAPTARAYEKLHIIRANDVFVLHFDCCTFDNWMLKWKRRLDKTGRVAGMREERKRQFAAFSEVYQTGAEAKLLEVYRQQCIIPAYEKVVLFGLGLLRRIRLREDYFVSF
jgi:hypothetical protein